MRSAKHIVQGQEVEIQTFAASFIIVDVAWNCRRVYVNSRENKSDHRMTDAQLEKSIRDRAQRGEPALIELPTVIMGPDDRPIVKIGFRRVLACQRIADDFPVTCIVRRGPVDDLVCRYDNLDENLQRQDLKPWELAEALTGLMTEHPDQTSAKVAARLDISGSHVRNLLRVKAKASPEFWELYTRNDGTITSDEANAVVGFPPEDQIKEWKRMRAAKRAERARKKAERRGKKGGKNGVRKAPQKWTVSPLAARDYLSWLSTTDKTRDYMRGAQDTAARFLGEKSLPVAFVKALEVAAAQ